MARPNDESTRTTYPQGFTAIDNRIISRHSPQISALGIALYVVLSFHADNVTRQCYPSLRTLSARLGICQRRVLKTIRVLEEAGLVRVVRARSSQGRRQVNVYTLLPIPDGQEPALPVLNDVAHPAVPAAAPLLSQGQQPAVPAAAPLLSQRQHPAVPAAAELDLINNTQLNQRECEGRVDNPSLTHPTPPAQLDHLAVKAYQEVWGSPPDALQRAAIVATVTDVPQWAEVVRQWRLAGYRRQNVAGMLDWYTQGIPERSDHYGRSAGGGRAGGGLGFASQRSGNRAGEWHSRRETPEEAARFDAEWNALLQEARQRSESDAA